MSIRFFVYKLGNCSVLDEWLTSSSAFFIAWIWRLPL